MGREKQLRIQKQRELLIEIEATRTRLQTLLINLEYVTDPELLDICIYELKAVQGRYQYLLKLAKKDQLTYNEKELELHLS